MPKVVDPMSITKQLGSMLMDEKDHDKIFEEIKAVYQNINGWENLEMTPSEFTTLVYHERALAWIKRYDQGK